MIETLPAATEQVNGHEYFRGPRGELLPVEAVKAADRLEDETVRRLFSAAVAAAQALAAFKVQAFDDVDAFMELLGERYGVRKGGAKGNVTLSTIDERMCVQVQVANLIRFGPELAAAKVLIDACLADWSSDSQVEIRAIVLNAFRGDKEGNLNRGAVLGLFQYDFTDERWLRAMDAIRDSIKVVGTKRYIRFSWRADPDGAWNSLSLNLATA